MMRMNDELRLRYEQLFDTKEKKAEAFDIIAENYYLGNFGTMQKTDFEVLMFSLFLEKILDISEEDINSYSDYTLAKQLGITQNRVSALKVKKQLQYPYEKFEWKKSFARMCKNARYEGEKIKINLRDKNLFYELKNYIDEKGSFVEATLTSSLLVIRPEDFFDLVGVIIEEENETALADIKKHIKKQYGDNKDFCDQIESEPLGKTLKTLSGNVMEELLLDAVQMVLPKSAIIGVDIMRSVAQIIVDKKKGR